MSRSTNSPVAVEVLRVFCDAQGAAGNELGVVLDAQDIAFGRRQAIAAELGYSETIFIERDNRVAIFTPTTELPFAGHPLVGAAWRLRVPVLSTTAGDIRARSQQDRAWILARPEQSPAWECRQLASAAEVDALIPPSEGHVQYWAWADEQAGEIRARVFAADYGVGEDPATGSAAIVLCASLARPILIDQGQGSVIQARPIGDGTVELGGRVIYDRTLQLHA